jgi:GT2 family glycosyltransferase
MNHIIYIGIESDSMINNVVQYIDKFQYTPIIGNNISCFSELVNKCILQCTTNIFIFCSHRVSPTNDDIIRMISLLESGYGYVGLYRFACFGIHMDILREMGGFDEGFIPGGYEDDDFKLRLQYNNIGFYEDHSVIYRAGESYWGRKETSYNILVREEYFNKKYNIHYDTKTIIIPKYVQRAKTMFKYKPFSESVLIEVCTFYCTRKLHTFTIMNDT